MQERLTRERLTALLRQAALAHAEFERYTGEQDEDWPTWYADFIISRLEFDAKQEGSRNLSGLDA